MKQDELNLLLKQNNYLKGGTKEACIVARDFLRFASVSESKIRPLLSSVSPKEFAKAVSILIAYASQSVDTIPEKWYCDDSCQLSSFHTCPGNFAIDKDADRLCPYYRDGGLI